MSFYSMITVTMLKMNWNTTSRSTSSWVNSSLRFSVEVNSVTIRLSLRLIYVLTSVALGLILVLANARLSANSRTLDVTTARTVMTYAKIMMKSMSVG